VTDTAESLRNFFTGLACCATGAVIATIGLGLWLGFPIQEYAHYLEHTSAGMAVIVGGAALFGPLVYMSFQLVRIAQAR
jgi:hypothetical protein